MISYSIRRNRFADIEQAVELARRDYYCERTGRQLDVRLVVIETGPYAYTTLFSFAIEDADTGLTAGVGSTTSCRVEDRHLGFLAKWPGQVEAIEQRLAAVLERRQLVGAA